MRCKGVTVWFREGARLAVCMLIKHRALGFPSWRSTLPSKFCFLKSQRKRALASCCLQTHPVGKVRIFRLSPFPIDAFSSFLTRLVDLQQPCRSLFRSGSPRLWLYILHSVPPFCAILARRTSASTTAQLSVEMLP